jgi:hypothetical protein
MRPETLHRCVKEAKRFIALAEVVPIIDHNWKGEKTKPFVELPSKYSAAAKRSSMDLSRALADLRQGR